VPVLYSLSVVPDAGQGGQGVEAERARRQEADWLVPGGEGPVE
jgi:hypothetical protein